MRVLVTGANGFAGRHLVRELLAGPDVSVVGGSPDGSGLPGLEGVEWVELDVTSADSVRAVVRAHRPDRVYHLAGQSSVSGSFANPLATWDINAMGTARLLHVLEQEEVPSRVLVVSSAEVYGAVTEAEQPIRESHPIRPITPYGASKAAAEIAAAQVASGGRLEVVVSRSFNHVGPGQDLRFALPSMARQLVEIRRGEKEPVLRVGNLEARRDFLDVRDVARAYLALMESGVSGEAYNVCSGEAHSLLDMVQELVRLSGTGARIEVDPARFRPADIPVLVGDASRLRALGWQPSVPWEQTLRDVLASAEDE